MIKDAVPFCFETLAKDSFCSGHTTVFAPARLAVKKDERHLNFVFYVIAYIIWNI